MYREGLLVVVSGPSGAGKGTLLNLLKDSGDDNIRFSVSATTRAPRVGEVDGVNYFFKTKEEFMLMIENDELLNGWSTVTTFTELRRSTLRIP